MVAQNEGFFFAVWNQSSPSKTRHLLQEMEINVSICPREEIICLQRDSKTISLYPFVEYDGEDFSFTFFKVIKNQFKCIV